MKAFLHSSIPKLEYRGAQIEFANIGNEPTGMVINTDLGQGFYFYVRDR